MKQCSRVGFLELQSMGNGSGVSWAQVIMESKEKAAAWGSLSLLGSYTRAVKSPDCNFDPKDDEGILLLGGNLQHKHCFERWVFACWEVTPSIITVPGSSLMAPWQSCFHTTLYCPVVSGLCA